MALIPTAPAAAIESLQLELVTAIERNDRQALQLLIELAMVRFGDHLTANLICQLPSLVESELVPRCLRLLHGEHWTSVAKAILCQAAHELIRIGITPGVDISLGIANDGTPQLLMKSEVYQSISKIPGSVHLIAPFLQVK